MAETRLQKYLAEAGVASRRRSEELILQGRVKVNGTVVTALGTKVSDDDTVAVDDRDIKPEENKVYIILNKPMGYVTTSKDQFSRKTVLDLVEGVKERIYPVGRLDYETSGLLLLTNDGELAFRLTHPGHEVEKVYRARIEGHLTEREISVLQRGVMIEDYVTSPAKVNVLEKNQDFSVIELTIHEGRNRQVRKMLEAVGHPVHRLKRTAIGPVSVGSLEEGRWRYLDTREIALLKTL